jgi:uncharacterized protein (DUF1810 family)
MLNDDPFNLNRFIRAQESVYENVLWELQNGRKQTHWMWFIFPQIEGLGYSPMSKLYSIKNIMEAREYLQHPILGARLLDCARIVLELKDRSAHEIFGSPDDLKLQSSMTLFTTLTDSGSVFEQVLDNYYNGERDGKTLDLLKSLA